MDRDYARYLLEKTREDYNSIAEDFSRTRSRIWEELKFLAKYVNDYEKILDLGCGNGRLYEMFQEKTVDYYGIDNSRRLIEIAQKRYPQFKFQVADALNLPFSADFFDKVFCLAVLHHIPSKEFRLKVLRNINRVLKPDGLLILTVWKLRFFKRLFILFKYIILKILGRTKLDFGDALIPWGKKLNRYLHSFSENELKKLVEEAGFKVKEIRIIERPRSKESNILLIAEPS
jgi:SAM-dependent methyltransferase